LEPRILFKLLINRNCVPCEYKNCVINKYVPAIYYFIVSEFGVIKNKSWRQRCFFIKIYTNHTYKNFVWPINVFIFLKKYSVRLKYVKLDFSNVTKFSKLRRNGSVVLKANRQVCVHLLEIIWKQLVVPIFAFHNIKY